MELVQLWEPERRYVWMKRWMETQLMVNGMVLDGRGAWRI
jgi:hypothetical protein